MTGSARCRWIAGLAMLATSLAQPSPAQTPASKPRIPPGVPSTGFAVALLSTGIDYTKPHVLERIVRDGEGEIVGWDAVDEDRRPYLASPNDTAIRHGGDATRLIQGWPMRFVHVRVAPDRPETVARAIAFVARSPARIVVVPMAAGDPVITEAVRVGARSAPHLLFIVAAGETGAGAPSAAISEPNVLVVDTLLPKDDVRTRATAHRADAIIAPAAALREAPGAADAAAGDSRWAALAAAGLFVCRSRLFAGAASPADARRTILGLAVAIRDVPVPVIEACGQ